jgi:hypothetical protein
MTRVVNDSATVFRLVEEEVGVSQPAEEFKCPACGYPKDEREALAGTEFEDL